MAASSSSASSTIDIPVGTRLRNRWQVRRKIGEGGCGKVYEVKATRKNMQPRFAALKVEPAQKYNEDELLKMEAHVMSRLRHSKHVCELLMSGKSRKGDFNFIVLSLLGRSLADLRRSAPKQKFTIRTTIAVSAPFSNANSLTHSYSTTLWFQMGVQCLMALHDLHSAKYVHRDVKPSNFALGFYEREQRTIMIFDFGLARQFLKTRKRGAKTAIMWREARKNVAFRGTIKYCSANVHRRLEQGPHDDLWSMFYMLIEMIVGWLVGSSPLTPSSLHLIQCIQFQCNQTTYSCSGRLPWRSLERDGVRQMKESIPDEELLRACPREFRTILSHLKSLRYGTNPSYKLLMQQFDNTARRKGYRPTDPFDWENGSPIYKQFWWAYYSLFQGACAASI